MADPYLNKEIAGQFRIVEKIGSGGMSAVYRAEEIGTGRFVALKILRAQFQNRPDIVSRFRREARAMSQLQHPNTARVFMYGQLDDGACYFAMEHLQGVNLAQYLRKRGPLPMPEALAMMIDVCGALQEAHAAGIIHRDLKPENIIVLETEGTRPMPKVLDFGLAKLSDRQMRPGSGVWTQQGMVFGTPEFMSPEQARGLPLDARSDIYSLGVMLYELITGKLPFDAKTPLQYAELHVKEPPMALRLRRQDLDPVMADKLQIIFDRVLAKDPTQRPATAAEFGGMLQRVLNGDAPWSAPAPGSAAANSREPFASSSRAKMLIGVAVAAVALIAAFWLRSR